MNARTSGPLDPSALPASCSRAAASTSDRSTPGALQIVHDAQAVPLHIARQRAKPRAGGRIQNGLGFAQIGVRHPREQAAEKLTGTIKDSQIPRNNRVRVETIGITINVTALCPLKSGKIRKSKMNIPY